MTPDAERFERLSEMFAHARDLEPEARSAYLANACGSDGELRAELEALLAEDARGILDAVDHALVGGAAPITPSFAARPELVGKYRIVGVCGSGGMGTVYEATQESPNRRVAVKVVQSASLRPDVLSRFKRETEILGRLEHPNIAQIFEAGEFEQDGQIRPFFAMEFVDGVSLVDFATRRQLTIDARIDLLAEVCDAIQYAHDRGVVHRDLKPDNILVVETSDSRTGSHGLFGRPKILDFGVARLVDADTELTMRTSDGTLLGSVAYMSPEQASGGHGDVDGRADLYSLGVIAFELLSGALPYAVRGRPLAEALDAIRHQDPTLLQAVDPSLAQDLGTIIDKCLQKDRSRRYDTVAELAADLRAFREFKPIKARPPSSWYQLQKFAQRNRALVGGVIASTLALTVGAIAAVLFALQATENATTAEDNQRVAERATYRANILAASTLIDSDPAQARRILDAIPEEARGWEHRYLTAAESRLLLEFGTVATRTIDVGYERTLGEMFLLPGDREVLVRSAADQFTIWEVATGRELRSFRAPGDVHNYAVAEDGSVIAAILASGTVAIADPRASAPTWETWLECDGPVETLAMSRDGERLAVVMAEEATIGRPGAWTTVGIPPVGQLDFVRSAAFDRDGGSLFFLSSDLHRVDSATGEPRHEPIPSTQGHWSLAVSPTGERLAAGQYRHELRIHDLASGALEMELFGHEASIVHVAFDGDDRAVTVDMRGSVRVWDLEGRETRAVFDTPGTLRAQVVSGDRLLTLTNGRLRLWSLKPTRSRDLRGHEGRAFDLVFSPDNTLLASCAPWSSTLVWDPLETEPIQRRRSEGRQFAFDGAGDVMIESMVQLDLSEAVVDWPTNVREDTVLERRRVYALWLRGELHVDGRRAPLVPGPLQVLRAVHPIRRADVGPSLYVDGQPLDLGGDAIAQPMEIGPVDVGAHPKLMLGGMYANEFMGDVAEWIAFDGRLSDAAASAVEGYLSARRDGATVAFPKLDDGTRPLLHFRADRESIELSPKGGVRRWGALDDRDRHLRVAGSHDTWISFVARDGAGPDRVHFNNAWGGNHWLEMEFPEARDVDALTVFWLGSLANEARHRQTAYSIGHLSMPYVDSVGGRDVRKVGAMMSFSPDGRFLASCAKDTTEYGWVQVREMETSALFASFEDEYFCVDFHADSRRLACGHLDGRVDVFDVLTSERLTSFVAHDDYCRDVAFSPDGTRLATAGSDKAVRLWDTTDFEQVLELPGHRSYVPGVAWSPDGTMLASACGDKIVRVFDTVPKHERHGQRLANRVLLHEVRAEVEALHSDAPEQASERIREIWSGDVGRRRAAQKVLSRLVSEAAAGDSR